MRTELLHSINPAETRRVDQAMFRAKIVKLVLGRRVLRILGLLDSRRIVLMHLQTLTVSLPPPLAALGRRLGLA